MEAQTTTASVVGAYYLKGVMETAPGFKLNPDHSFNFFFSYGAPDRSGEGQWKQEKNTIIFNSPLNQSKDYSQLLSRKQASPGITIHIIDDNEYIKKLVHAVIRSGDKEVQADTEEQDFIRAAAATADSIVLLFEWCPDKRFVFTVSDTTHNYFEFRLEASLMNVLFNDFRLNLTQDEINGPHPMDKTKLFHYKKSVH